METLNGIGEGTLACCISSWYRYTCTGDQALPPHSTGQFGVAHPCWFKVRWLRIMSSRVRPSPSATLARIDSGILVRKNWRASARKAISSWVKLRSIPNSSLFGRGASQPVGELLAEFHDFRRDHDLAVAGPGIAREVVVM